MTDACGIWGPVLGFKIHHFIPIPLEVSCVYPKRVEVPRLPRSIFVDRFKAAHLRAVVAACGDRIVQPDWKTIMEPPGLPS